MHESPEQVADQLRQKIWRERHQIWGDQVPADPVDMLDPRIAIQLLGYEFELVPEILGWPPDKHHALAGEEDPGRKQVTVSEQFGFQSARFTAAHELAHVMLHSGRMFRERPISGPRLGEQNPAEREADKFAADFLMPKKLLLTRIRTSFDVEPPIVVRDAEAFWLDMDQPEDLLRASPNSHELAFALAKCPRDFHGNRILSLAEQFKVSVQAMAYRVQELRLI
ncbi:MAG: ImmA/IrrE family metallo-endopeptidase [Gammaproteobacteria bacterium]|nr:ImmA/IrrE family metallo-endopeptidase [Gammaproteobacteria bacterium]